MGDHVPAFLLRELRIEPEAAEADAVEPEAASVTGDVETIAEAPVAEAKPKARRTRKAASAEATAA
jgi:hypothetical protein